ncbi:MAG: tetratricopeptide repeat protein [Hyphomicrobium sp.]|nr:tetratricopeptide repeat protein [Hyphomicrobium sp.]
MRSILQIVLAFTVALTGVAGGIAHAADDAPVISRAQEAATHLVRGEAAQAVEAFTDALKDTSLANDRRATMLNDRAVAYARIGQPKRALDDFNQAVQMFAEYPAAYNNRGNLLLSLDNVDEAIKDFDRAIVLAPGYAAAFSNRASAQMRRAHYQDAIRDYSKAISLMPSSAAPLSGRGVAFLATGKPHAAIRDFSRAVNADARFASAYRNRAEARIAVGQKAEAIEDLSRALAFDASNAEIYVVRGYAYLADANTASAIKDFSRAIELDGQLAAAFQGRGLANSLAEAHEEAFGDLNRAIELDPRSPVAFAYRAYVYKQTGQPDIGAKDIETATKLDPNNAETAWARGEIAEARGQADTAVEDFRKVLLLKPGWRLASEALQRLGAGADISDDREMLGLGFESWRVVVRANAYFAINDLYPKLRVPLEMMGEGKPQLVAFELKPPPHKGYGVLRYSGGIVISAAGPEITELVAILDLDAGTVISIQPHRQGARVATWTWDDDRVQIASIDGVTDEFQLRAAVAEPVPVAAGAYRKGDGQRGPKSSAWAPWDQAPGSVGGQRSETRQARSGSRQKPKTLFELLFSN